MSVLVLLSLSESVCLSRMSVCARLACDKDAIKRRGASIHSSTLRSHDTTHTSRFRDQPQQPHPAAQPHAHYHGGSSHPVGGGNAGGLPDALRAEQCAASRSEPLSGALGAATAADVWRNGLQVIALGRPDACSAGGGPDAVKRREGLRRARDPMPNLCGANVPALLEPEAGASPLRQGRRAADGARGAAAGAPSVADASGAL